eukprot:760937-Rhodomonas_salina.1
MEPVHALRDAKAGSPEGQVLAEIARLIQGGWAQVVMVEEEVVEEEEEDGRRSACAMQLGTDAHIWCYELGTETHIWCYEL